MLPATAGRLADATSLRRCLCAQPVLQCCPSRRRRRRRPQVQFQAVALSHALRANDRLAISKLVTQLTRSNVRSPMAQCLLVRYVAQVSGAGAAWAESRPATGWVGG